MSNRRARRKPRPARHSTLTTNPTRHQITKTLTELAANTNTTEGPRATPTNTPTPNTPALATDQDAPA